MPFIRLIPQSASADTIKEIEKLLAGAKLGDPVGLAYIAIGRKSYTVNAVGQAAASPLLARGMLADLEDLLRDLQPNRGRI